MDGLSNATREKLFAARGQISRSLIDYYSSNSEPEPEVKLGTLYLDVYTFSTVTQANQFCREGSDVKERVAGPRNQNGGEHAHTGCVQHCALPT